MAVTDTPTLRLVLALAAETCVHSPYDGVDRKRARARVTCVTMVNIPSTVAVRSRRSCHGPAVQRLAARRRLRHRDEPGGITRVRGSDAIEPFRRRRTDRDIVVMCVNQNTTGIFQLGIP